MGRVEEVGGEWKKWSSSPGKYNIRSQFTFMCGNYTRTHTQVYARCSFIRFYSVEHILHLAYVFPCFFAAASSSRSLFLPFCYVCCGLATLPYTWYATKPVCMSVCVFLIQ